MSQRKEIRLVKDYTNGGGSERDRGLLLKDNHLDDVYNNRHLPCYLHLVIDVKTT